MAESEWKKFYYYGIEYHSNEDIKRLYVEFKQDYGHIPNIEIEDRTETRGFLVKVPFEHSSQLPVEYKRMPRVEVNDDFQVKLTK